MRTPGAACIGSVMEDGLRRVDVVSNPGPRTTGCMIGLRYDPKKIGSVKGPLRCRWQLWKLKLLHLSVKKKKILAKKNLFGSVFEIGTSVKMTIDRKADWSNASVWLVWFDQPAVDQFF